MDCSPPGSSVHAIPRERRLERVAVSSYRGYSRPRDLARLSNVSGVGRRALYHGRHWFWPRKRPPGAAMVEGSLLSGAAASSGLVLCLLSQGHRLLLESWLLRQTSAAPWAPPRTVSPGLRWGTGLQAGRRVKQAPCGPVSFPGAWGPRRDSPRRNIQLPRGSAASPRVSLLP